MVPKGGLISVGIAIQITDTTGILYVFHYYHDSIGIDVFIVNVWDDGTNTDAHIDTREGRNLIFK